MNPIFLLPLFACTTSETSESATKTTDSQYTEPVVLSSSGSCSIFVEVMTDDSSVQGTTVPTGLVSLAPHRSLQHRQDGTLLVDEFTQSVFPLDATSTDGVQLSSSQLLLALDGELFLMNDGTGDLVYSPINDLLPVPIEQVEIVTDTLWFLGAGRLFRWNDGRLLEVALGDRVVMDMMRSTEGLAVLTPSFELLWFDGDGVSTVSRRDVFPTAMAPTASKGLLMTEGSSEIHRYQNGDWTQFEIEGTGRVLQLISNVNADVVWIEGEDTSIVYDRDTICTIDEIPEGSWLDVDPLGRLITVQDGNLLRYSLGRPVGVVGLLPHEDLTVAKEVFFLPTLPDSITELSVWVGVEELEVNAESNSTVLNPENFTQGTHSIRMVVEADDNISITEFPFVVVALEETKWSDVEPIYVENCSSCHSEGALIPLYTADLWRQNIDLIIDEVSAQTMPLGTSPLSEEDILTIRGWKQGGFQE